MPEPNSQDKTQPSQGTPATQVPAIPDHELIRCIGSGSYGEVWLARSATRRYRAIKIVYRNTFDHDRPYEREFSGILKFEPISRTHDGFVDVLHVGRNDQAGYFFYVMELGDDERTAQEINPDTYSPKTLRSEIYNRGQLSVDECVQLGLSLTAALVHLHEHGLVHRDIKPSNIIFVDGVPELADIGLVSSVTEARSFVGTEGFIPPEGPGTVQADLYSLGKVLYEACTGKDRLEFPELPTDLMEQPDGEKLLELNEIILKACESNPRKRFRAASQMLVELELLNKGESIKCKRVRERRLKLAARSALAIVSMGTVASFTLLQIQKETIRKRLVAEAGRQAELTRQAEEQTQKQAELAEKAKLEAKVRQAEAQVSQADAFASTGRWEDAKVAYQKAAEAFADLGISTLWPDSGLSQVLERCPPEINSFAPQSNAAVGLASSPRVKVISSVLHAIVGLAFSSDGQMALSGSEDGSVRLWELKTGRALQALTWKKKVTSMAFSSDGRLALAGSKDGSVRLWEAATGRTLHIFNGHTNSVTSVAFSFDGRLALSGSEDKTARVWEVDTGRELSVSSGYDWGIQSVAFSPDGRLAMSGTWWVLRLWDVATGAEVRTFLGQNDWITCVAFSPDGRLALSGGGDRTARLWDVATGSELRAFRGHTKAIRSVAFSPDGRLAVSGSEDKTARLWDLATGRVLRTYTGHTQTIRSVTFSPEGRLALSGSEDGSIRLWETETLRARVPFAAHPWGVTSVTFSPDGRLALSSGNDNTVRLWEVATLRQLRTYSKHTEAAKGVAFSRDGRRALWGNLNAMRLWELETDRELQVFTGHTKPVTSVTFSPNGPIALSSSLDGTVRLWDLATGREQRMYRANEWGLDIVTVSSNGLLALTGGWLTMRLWEPATGIELRAFKQHQFGARSLAFSPDSRLSVSGTWDNSIRLWELPTGRAVRTLEGHRNLVTSVAFSPDGRFLLSGSTDNTVRLWDLATGRELRTFTAHTNAIASVVFSPDGKLALSGSEDGTIGVWDFGRPAIYREFEAPLEHARKAVRENPNDGTALAVLGDWYAVRGLWDWAIKLLEQARNNGATVSSVTLARCYWQIDELDAARREFARALKGKEESESYLNLCLVSETPAMPSNYGYRLENSEVVFDFDQNQYEWTTQGDDGKWVEISKPTIQTVAVAGEFNSWSTNAWPMQKVDDSHFVLHKNLADFGAQTSYQFKFVINGYYWVEPPPLAANRMPIGGNVFNLVLELPAASPRQNIQE